MGASVTYPPLMPVTEEQIKDALTTVKYPGCSRDTQRKPIWTRPLAKRHKYVSY